MPNYDFHSIFSPIEFEKFVRDILEEKEGIPFEAFREGKDGGIDLRNISKDGFKTIVQVKRYKADFSQLKRSIKESELKNVKKEKPDRYILVTSLEYSRKEKDEIFDLFEGFVKSHNDILGKDELNKYLGKYDWIEKRHVKLWLSSSAVLQNLLAQEIHSAELNHSRFELENILDKNRIRIYVQNDSFLNALKVLEENNFVLITGISGIGKTTLGRHLVLYYLSSDESTEFINISTSIQEGYKLFRGDKKQIFFFDDFWGQIFNDKWSINEDKRFIAFIEKINKSSNKKLILTTRDYVLAQGIKTYRELGLRVDFAKCTIDPSKYTNRIKARILYNHIFWSNLSKEVVTEFIREKKYLNIIRHKNYSPRMIEKYVEIASLENYPPHAFHFYFSKYLDDPNEYWESTFKKQTFSSQVILLILFISNTPILRESIEQTYKEAVKRRSEYGFNISLLEFDESLKELEDTFITIEPYYGNKQFKIDFQNPSLKDFLLEYLRHNLSIYGEFLIQSATFFNQLIFAFDTKQDKNIDDYDMDYSIHGKKIALTDKLKEAIKEKFLTQFDSLKYSELEEREYAGFTLYSNDRDAIVWKLVQITNLFEIQYDIEIRNFAINKFVEIIKTYEEGHKLLPKDGMDNLSTLIERILPYYTIDAQQLLEYFYKSITFTSEFLGLHSLGKLFPKEYQELIGPRIKEIRKKIKETILDDIDYYLDIGMEYEAELIFDTYYPDVFKAFGMRMTKKFEAKMREVSSYYKEDDDNDGEGANYIGFERSSEYEEEKLAEEEINKEFESLVESEEEQYFGESNLSYESELKKYLLGELKNRRVATKMIETLEKLNFQYMDLTDRPSKIDIIIDYFKIHEELPEDYTVFLEGLFKMQLERIDSMLDLNVFFQQLGFQSYLDDRNTFTKEYLGVLFKKVGLSQLDSEVENGDFYPILKKEKRWYKFSVADFQEFLAAKYLSNLSKNERIKFYSKDLNELYDNNPDSAKLLWRFLRGLDLVCFTQYFALPILEEIEKSIDYTNEQNLVCSFFSIFQFDAEYTSDEENIGLEMYSSSNSNVLFADILMFYEIPFSIDDIDLFFYRHLTEQENKRLGINTNPEIWSKFIAFLEQNCVRKEVSLATKEEIKVYSISFLDLIHDNRFYKLLEELGLCGYLSNGFKALKQTKVKLKEISSI